MVIAIKKYWMLFGILLGILLGTLTPGTLFESNYIDKVLHAGVFFVLAISFFYKLATPMNMGFILSWLLLGGLFVEAIQQFIPGRSADINDVIANMFGVLAAWYVFAKHGHLLHFIFMRLGV